MQVVDIVDRLKEVIGKYTNDFSDIVDVSARGKRANRHSLYY